MPLCLKSILIALGSTIAAYIISDIGARWLLIERQGDISTLFVFAMIFIISIFYIFERIVPVLNSITVKKIKSSDILITQK